jgi:hypothetical protein
MKPILLTLSLLLSLACLSQKDYRWKYIRESGLQLIEANVTRTGKVVKVPRVEDDGDLHVWILTQKDLVLCEIICYKQVPICAGYKNQLPRPKVGDRIRVKGDLVYDSKHKWQELHPVKKIQFLKPSATP